MPTEFHSPRSEAKTLKRRSVFGSYVTTGSYGSVMANILSLAENRIPSYVCFANVHMVVEAFRNPSFQRIVNDAELVLPDGKPLSIYLSIVEGKKQPRLCGMDIFPDLLREAARRGLSVYFYGSTLDTLELIRKKAAAEFPNLKISGWCSPPFRPLSDEEKSAHLQMINSTRPNLVLVSLGCPKQEKWMADNKEKIRGCLLGLGQAFNVYAGKEKRLPVWMRSLSLEWAYRLYLEPRRLWKRYLLTNSYFIALTLREVVLTIVNALFSKPRKASASMPTENTTR